MNHELGLRRGKVLHRNFYLSAFGTRGQLGYESLVRGLARLQCEVEYFLDLPRSGSMISLKVEPYFPKIPLSQVYYGSGIGFSGRFQDQLGGP
jgi:hypothetical protein